MGTKHHYTEKECKVCFQTKPREEFPAFGGLTCRECIRVRDRENYPNRYERDKKNPEWVNKNRQRARDYKRKKKQQEGSTLAVTPQELAAQLDLLAEQVPSSVAQELANQMQALQQAMQQQLGPGSPGAQEIGGAASNVTQQVDNAIAALEQLRITLREVANRARAV